MKSVVPVESWVPVKTGVPTKSGGPVETVAATAAAAMTPGDAWPCGNDQERKGEEGHDNCPTHAAYLAD